MERNNENGHYERLMVQLLLDFEKHKIENKKWQMKVDSVLEGILELLDEMNDEEEKDYGI